MPQVGDRVRGVAIGRPDRRWHIWVECVDCGEGRWISGRQFLPERCQACAKKIHQHSLGPLTLPLSERPGPMTTTPCAHHWVIETATGPVSQGKCQLCGEEREFNNSMEFVS
jgi:ribosomal protein S27E